MLTLFQRKTTKYICRVIKQDNIAPLVETSVEVNNGPRFRQVDQQGKMLAPTQLKSEAFRDYWLKMEEERTGVSEAAGINCRMPKEALSPSEDIAHDWRTHDPTEII